MCIFEQYVAWKLLFFFDNNFISQKIEMQYLGIENLMLGSSGYLVIYSTKAHEIFRVNFKYQSQGGG